MVWKILRPSFWILDRKLREANRFIVTGTIALLLLGGQWLFNNLIADKLTVLASEQAASVIALMLPMGLFVFLLFALLALGDTIYSLYLASDLELLMVAPIPYRSIYLAKLVQGSRGNIFPAIIYGGALAAFGYAQEAAASYYLIAGWILLAQIIATTAVALIAAIVLVRLIPPEKLSAWLPIAVALLMMALMLGQQPAMTWFLSQTRLNAFIASALLDASQLVIVALVLSGAALVTGLAAYQLFERAFYGGWNRIREVPTRATLKEKGTRRTNFLVRLTRRLPAPMRFILIKEWLELRRTPLRLVGFASMHVLLLPILWLLFTNAEMLRPLFFWFLLIFGLGFSSISLLADALMALGREGRQIELLQSAPISMRALMRCKFWSSPWTLIMLIWSLVYVIAGILIGLSGWLIGILIVSTAWGLIAATALAMGYGGLVADFSVDDPARKSVGALHGYLVSGIFTVIIFVSLTSVAWLVVHLFPSSPISLPFQSLAGFTSVAWLLSESAWPLVTIISAQVVIWVGVKLLWNAAIHRLERLEI
jgi:hypothetical protein